MIHSDRSINIVSVFHIGDSYGLFLNHNVVVNLEVEENRRVDVQAGFSKLRLYIYLLKILIGICVGQARSLLNRTLISTIPVFEVRPFYFFRSSLSPKCTCQDL